MLRTALVSLVLLPLAASSTSWAAPSLAVLPLRAEGLQLNEANRLNLMLQARAGTRGGYDVQDQTLTTQLVEASQALGVDCDVNAVACAIELGKLADVQFVLIGQAAKLPSLPGANGNVDAPTIGVHVQLVDVKRAITTRRIIGRVSTDAEQQTTDVDAAAAALFGSDPLSGLTLDVEPAGSTVHLDGIALGASPLSEVTGLLPGGHVITVERKGYLPWTTSFALEAGRSAQLTARLEIDPDAEKEVISDAQIAVPFVGAGVGALTAVIGATLIAVGVQPWLAHEQANAGIADADPNDPLFPDRVATLNAQSSDEAAQWQSWGQPTTVAGAVAVGVGVVVVAAGLSWGLVLLNSEPGETD